MATGKVHNRASMALSIVSFFVAGYVSGSTHNALYCGCGTLSGILLTPDLDVLPTVDKEKIRNRQPLLWRWLWFPYADVINHRAIISHFPIVSTTIRILYLALPIIIIANRLNVYLYFDRQMIIWYFIGLCISDLGHWILDGCPIRKLL